jgi:hypothetical protein
LEIEAEKSKKPHEGLCSIREPFGALLELYEALQETQDGLKWHQDGPKRGPRWPQESPREAQDGPKRAQESLMKPYEALGSSGEPFVRLYFYRFMCYYIFGVFYIKKYIKMHIFRL